MDIVSKPNNDRHFLSFSRKLFLSVISLFLIFAACFIAYQYQREKEYKVELLDTQLQDYNDRLHQELRYLPDSLWTSRSIMLAASSMRVSTDMSRSRRLRRLLCA
jgi:two-component system, OmpR family, phosphate regulon sensor histidine kinase PhoR